MADPILFESDVYEIVEVLNPDYFEATDKEPSNIFEKTAPYVQMFSIGDCLVFSTEQSRYWTPPLQLAISGRRHFVRKAGEVPIEIEIPEDVFNALFFVGELPKLPGIFAGTTKPAFRVAQVENKDAEAVKSGVPLEDIYV